MAEEHPVEMSIKQRRTYLGAFAALLLLVGGPLSAATIEVKFSTSNGQKFDYTIDGKVKTNSWALEFSPVRLDFDSDSGTWTPDLTTISYCVDLHQSVGNGNRFEVDLQSAVAKGDNYRNAAWLMNQFSPTANTAAKKAGLQVAIWEAVYDSATSLNLDSGRFSVQSTGSDTYANAKSYLDALALVPDVSAVAGLERYMVAYSATKQDLLIATPIPTAVWLFGSGLIGLLGLSHRNRIRSASL
jgi:hypothetical protein